MPGTTLESCTGPDACLLAKLESGEVQEHVRERCINLQAAIAEQAISGFAGCPQHVNTSIVLGANKKPSITWDEFKKN